MIPLPVGRTLMLSLAVLLLPSPAGAQSSGVPDFAGTWEGVLDAGAARIRLVFHIEVGADGSLSGTMDSPDQGATGIPASAVSAEGSAVTFAVATLAMQYRATLTEDGASLEGTFTQGPARLPLTVTRVAEPTAPDRPQHPTPPFPYAVEEVEVPVSPGVTLSGTLTIPEGEGPFPAAVLVSGSGPQDRDESLMGHKPFLVLSDHLTRRGVAVLRYDDRGVGNSTGTFATATTVDFAEDAIAAASFLKGRSGIGAVGIVGHSEGGLVGPMAATRSDDVSFVVMLAGPGLTGEEIVLLQSDLIARAEGTPEAAVAANRETQRRLFAAVRSHADPVEAEPRLRALLEEALADQPAEARTPAAVQAQVAQVNSPWFRFFLTYDPRPTLEKVTVPVLALNGALDLQVPAEQNLQEVSQALKRGGNPDATATALPGLNHLFQTAGTGSPTEYATITETMSPVALEAVSSWILQRFSGRDRGSSEAR